MTSRMAFIGRACLRTDGGASLARCLGGHGRSRRQSTSSGDSGSSLVFPLPGCGTAFPPGFRRCFDLGMNSPLCGVGQEAGTIPPFLFMSNLALMAPLSCCKARSSGLFGLPGCAREESITS